MALRYVDNALASGANNGSSWANAWRTIGAIQWGVAGGVNPGDTLYLSGGTTSKTYTGSGSTTILTVGASGSSGLPITISGGVDAGHNGTVIIDGQSGGRDCIDIISRTFVTIQNLNPRNPGPGFDCIWCTGSGNIIIRNNTCNIGGTNSNLHSVGIEMRSSTAANSVLNNLIDSGANFTDQTDCIYMSVNNFAGTITVAGNTINNNNLNATGHNDGIQIGDNTCDFLIDGNTVTIPSPGGANVHGMNLFNATNATSQFTVRNNIINAIGASQSDGMLLQSVSPNGGLGRFYVYNNTIYTSFKGISLFVNLGSINVLSEFKNNLIYMTAGTAFVNPNSWAPTAASQVDYNSIFLSGGAAAYSGTHASWNAHTVSTDPLFVTNGIDFHLQATSPCLNAGTTVAAVTVDKDGVTRPQGVAYDIGAYERAPTFTVGVGASSGIATVSGVGISSTPGATQFSNEFSTEFGDTVPAVLAGRGRAVARGRAVQFAGVAVVARGRAGARGGAVPQSVGAGPAAVAARGRVVARASAAPTWSVGGGPTSVAARGRALPRAQAAPPQVSGSAWSADFSSAFGDGSAFANVVSAKGMAAARSQAGATNRSTGGLYTLHGYVRPTGFAGPSTSTIQPPTLIFSDTFDAAADLQNTRTVQPANKWALIDPRTPDGRGGPNFSELGTQYWPNIYAPGLSVPNLYFVSGGQLHLGLVATPSGIQSAVNTAAGTNMPFVGSLVNSTPSYWAPHNYHEIVATVPKIPGFTFEAALEDPSTPTRWPPEIDIGVFTNADNIQRIIFNVWSYGGGAYPHTTLTVQPSGWDGTQPTTYGVDVGTTNITFYVNGTQVWQTPTPPDRGDYDAPVQWYLLTASGYLGDQSNPDPANLPAYVVIDSVKVYSGPGVVVTFPALVSASGSARPRSKINRATPFIALGSARPRASAHVSISVSAHALAKVFPRGRAAKSTRASVVGVLAMPRGRIHPSTHVSRNARGTAHPFGHALDSIQAQQIIIPGAPPPLTIWWRLSTVTPSHSMQEKPRVLRNTFGDGYGQTIPDGLTPLVRTMTLTWENIDHAEVDRMIQFFKNSVGTPISFVAPRDLTPRNWMVMDWRRTSPQPDADTITVTFEDRPFFERPIFGL